MRTTRTGRLLLAGLLAATLAGCDVAFDPLAGSLPNFEGRYSYHGTVHGARQYHVTGSLRISQQFHDEALVSIDWRYREGLRTLLELRTQAPAVARIDRFGNIRFDFFGEFFYGGQWVPFELEHRGRLRGRTITGDWYLWTGLHTEETGSFEARR